ncbi:MAG: esterase-like activity of phytase family protein [Thermomicrobiales bacterium]|nr:esterase-like activity of phytase family protein [Thermomicrobiales bacterium]
MCHLSAARLRPCFQRLVCLLVLSTILLIGCSGPDASRPEATGTAAPDTTPLESATATAAPPTVTTATDASTPTEPSGASCAPGVDILGFSDALDKLPVGDHTVGNISAIAWAGGDSYLGAADRDGVIYRMTFPLDSSPQVDDLFRLTDENGQPWSGDAIDVEGLAIDGDDLLAASEVGPTIRRFNASGQLLDEYDVPTRFRVASEGDGGLNETFESLAIDPAGASLWTANEKPLGSDGFDSDGRGRVRLLQFQRDDSGFIAGTQFAYLTEPEQGLSELLVVDNTHLLALERGFSLLVGFTARVYLVSLDDATDVSAIDSLSDADVVPVTKRLLVDLGQCPVTPDGGPPGDFSPLLDNFEGMTFGPTLPDGRRSLILVSDDNGQSLEVTRLIVLAVNPDSLH